MDILRTIGYMAVWSVGFIAARALLASPMNSLENIIGGNGNNGGV